MGAWGTFVEVALVVPFVLLVLLLVPAPSRSGAAFLFCVRGREKTHGARAVSTRRAPALSTHGRLGKKQTHNTTHRAWQAGVLRLVDATLGLRVLGAFRLAHVMTAASGATLASAARAAAAARSAAGPAAGYGGASALTAALARRWRAERNAWIAFQAFAFWLILLRVHALVRAAASRAEGGAGATAPAPGPARTGAGVASPPLDRSASAAAAAARAAAKAAAVSGGAPSAPPLQAASRAEKKAQ
jgi:hypothetical protein